MTKPQLGFIGLGSMGKPMVLNLARAGYAVAVYDANAQAAAQLSSEHIRVMDTPAAVAEHAAIIITMLPTSAIVEEVLTGPEGVFAAMRPGTIIVDMSSGVPDMTKVLAAEAKKRDAQLVDAPVSGGVTRAQTGELSIMYGGSDETLKHIEPILQVMGSSVARTGDVGTAHAMKALNNLVSAGGFLIGIEAILLGKQGGLDPEVMVDILNASTGMNNSTQKKFKQFVLSGKYNAGFGLELMVKDLGIALGLDEGHKAQFSQRCLEIWSDANNTLGKGADHTELARHVSQSIGVPLT
ncbi:NAD(P)-dependent oxidoreductase [Advenella mimigardefordensis]|uniref:Putative NAD(P)-binding 6-phosphopgluconate dehydrogenase n=1 Tax=Advenella mimigardefordensis (strain DSM 17166 / LMG 22922 / DPN7) TaxID=1247726 RepID=W0PFZ7_ADVMD|nr:NAD(P)-dependent oxidoreductase [Advenella mimigardefordensis]AHG65616.1 putative NAD(P)-binding 6-phosphopgluconate dehydrogenase [Advenella mimigardefordensis DPN7]